MNKTLCPVIGVIGSMIASALGGWDSAIITLILCMITDYLTGVAVAVFFKNSPKTETGGLNSVAGFRGIVKKCVMLWFILIAYQLDKMLGWDFVRTAVIISFIANELLSICENAGLMGIKIPSAIKRCIDVLTEKGETDGN